MKWPAFRLAAWVGGGFRPIRLVRIVQAEDAVRVEFMRRDVVVTALKSHFEATGFCGRTAGMRCTGPDSEVN